MAKSLTSRTLGFVAVALQLPLPTNNTSNTFRFGRALGLFWGAICSSGAGMWLPREVIEEAVILVA